MMNFTPEQLLQMIGKQQVMIELLQAKLKEAYAQLDARDAQSETPAPSPATT